METQATNGTLCEPIIETETISVNNMETAGIELTQVCSKPITETETLSVDSMDYPPQTAGGELTQVCSEPVTEPETLSVDSMDYPPQTAFGELTQVCNAGDETDGGPGNPASRRRGLIILGTVLVLAILIIALGIGLGVVYGILGDDLFSPITTLKKLIDERDNIQFLLDRN